MPGLLTLLVRLYFMCSNFANSKFTTFSNHFHNLDSFKGPQNPAEKTGAETKRDAESRTKCRAREYWNIFLGNWNLPSQSFLSARNSEHFLNI